VIGRGLGREARDLARTLAVAAPPALALGVAILRPGALEHPGLAVGGALAASVMLALARRARVERRLRTATSVLASYREGDFSIRARADNAEPALLDLHEELNQLGDTLRENRLGAVEAWALLRKVMGEIDVVVLAFDEGGRLRLANDAALRALGTTEAKAIAAPAAELGLAPLLKGDAPRAVREELPLGPGPWELRRGAFRLSGEPHTLVVLSDVSSALRENEREAFRRLIRVMGHEINNSLGPIHSLAESLLARLAEAPPRPEGFERDLGDALGVIARRSDALGRFMASYARLARLPAPNLGSVDLAELVAKVAPLEPRVPVTVAAGPAVTLRADADQLEQVLINLLKNGADAIAGAGRPGALRVGWTTSDRAVVLTVEDDGPGLGDPANLFVPLFTTKPGGTGIGLVLCRSIVEAHGGRITLEPRKDGPGAIARVRLPLPS
jgi:nitrogen fixation/metabolism regulation signal transduction histidine kinase